MAGQASGGQKLTPNPNTIAPAGRGGDIWGANGGGVGPVSGGKPVGATLSSGETANNYQFGGTLGNSNNAVGVQISNGVTDRQLPDSSISSGGSNQG